MTLRIARVGTECLNTFGDLENARVLAMRAAWAGIPVTTVQVDHPDEWDAFDAIVLGSGTDGLLPEARALLEAGRDVLESALEDGVPVLAVSAGFELLGQQITTARGTTIPGLGLFPYSSSPSERVTGRLVVEVEGRQLVGFENHDRRVTGVTSPLGTVVEGIGNGDGHDGVRHGGLIGVHGHGPVLAFNPWLADEILGTISATHGLAYAPGPAHARIDGWAVQAAAAVH